MHLPSYIVMLMGSSTLIAFAGWFIAAKGAQRPSHAPHDESSFSCFSPKLPNITVFATGGTIAGSSLNSHDTTRYEIGSLGFQHLIDNIPELCSVSNIRGVQVANVGSHNIRSETLIHMAQEIQRDLDNPYTQGAVVTHGTDTLDETAFFLDLTIKSEKPVVVVGAMRPATAISADGPMNLLNAIALAASKSARGRGVMIVMNERIGAARFTSKTNANRLDAFRAGDHGFLGVFENVRPIFFYPSSRPLGHHHFDISQRSASAGLPKVDILFGYQGLEPALFKSAVDLGAKGVVLAGVGAGWWPTLAWEEVKMVAEERGIPVMLSRRPMEGYVDGSSGGAGCGFLDPQRCRIQLQLCLEQGLDRKAMESIFQHTDVG